MAQVGPLRECQVVVGSASTLLSPLWSQAAASGSLCFRYAFRNTFAVSAFFTTGGILFQSSGTRCEKKIFLTSSRNVAHPDLEFFVLQFQNLEIIIKNLIFFGLKI
jgi:hypothetical protein